MFKIKKQIYCLFMLSGLSSFQIAGVSWVALLAARNFSLIEIGLAESCFHLVSFLFEIPSGIMSDVFGRKRSMILSQCMFILSAFCMVFSKTITGVCVSLIFNALGYNFSSGTREALAYDSLKAAGHENRYIDFSSREYSIYRIGNASAIICAGFALLIGYQKAYLLDALLGIICLFFSCQLKEVELEKNQFSGKYATYIFQCFKDSFYFLAHNFRTLCFMLWNALMGAVSTLMIFFLQAKLTSAGVSDILLGPALFLISLGGAVGAGLVIKTVNWNYWKLSALCMIGIIAGVFCGISNLPLVMCIGGFTSNLCDDLLQVRTDALLNERFPSSQRATLISVSSLCFSIVMIILSPIAGYFFS